MERDTIAALSTPIGRGGIGVIRISGPDSYSVLKKIVRPFPKKITPRKYFHGFIEYKGKKIDECLFVFFPAPHSFSGEDIAEISLHSNPFLVEETLNTLVAIGVRLALPGEFSYRAYINGKMDLLRAEAINDLIQANSRYYAHLEFDALQGMLSKKIEEIRLKLIDLATRIETIIEFQEDHDFSKIPLEKNLLPIRNKIKQMLQSSRYNELMNHGIKVVIAGKVNVGKSTLFNSLLQEDRSIISSFPGTTRDYIKEKLFINGHPFELIDIAGFRNFSKNRLEKNGISRSVLKIEEADIVIFVLDGSRSIEEADKKIYKIVRKKKKLIVINKTDISSPESIKLIKKHFQNNSIVQVSAKQGKNLESIFSFFEKTLKRVTDTGEKITINSRQRDLLTRLLECLEKTATKIRCGYPQIEIIAEDVRSTLNIIGKLTGEVSSNDILKEIFGHFCIGK